MTKKLQLPQSRNGKKIKNFFKKNSTCDCCVQVPVAMTTTSEAATMSPADYDPTLFCANFLIHIVIRIPDHYRNLTSSC